MPDLPRRFVRALCGCAPQPWLDLAPGDRQTMMDRDDAFARRLIADETAGPATRIWTNRRCLVASRTQARLPTFAAAVETMRRAGWPVVTRRSGGTTVVHRQDVLNVSLALPGNGGLAIETGYNALLQLLAAACRAIGVAADSGWVDGAICNGRFNLQHCGRKLAGTAAFAQASAGRRVMLAHASIVLDGDLAEDLAAIGLFERTLGGEGTYTLAAHTTLAAAREQPASRNSPRRLSVTAA